MSLRRLHRIIGAVLLSALATAAGEGLLCLVPCFAASASVTAREAVAEPTPGGHCASAGVAHTRSEPSLGPSAACANDHAVGAWIGERAPSRASVDPQPVEALETIIRTGSCTRAGVTLVPVSTSSSPPGAFVPLRI